MTGLVVVPVHNEAGNLSRVIAALRARFPATNLLFIDDGSSDGSHLLLEQARVPYLRHPVNLGYEETLRTGMKHALERRLPYVAFFDGDGQHRVEDLEALVHGFEAEPADLVLGSRYLGAHGVPLTLRSATTRVLSRVASWLAGVRVTDVTNGLKLVSLAYIPQALSLPTEDMHAELVVGLARRGARIREHAITVLPREQGQSMYHLVKGLLYVPKTLLCLLGSLVLVGESAPTPGTDPAPGAGATVATPLTRDGDRA